METDALGGVTHYTYQQNPSRLSSVTDANGNPISYSYDGRGELLSVTYVDETSEHYVYDTAGKLISWTNRRGDTIELDFDSAGRVIRKRNPDGSQTTYAYNAVGNLTQIVDARGVTQFEYSPNDRVSRIVYPGTQSLEFEYNLAGKYASIRDGFGNETRYIYDPLGRMEEVRDGNDGVLAQYAYNISGRLERVDLGNGVYSTYTYDSVGAPILVANFGADDVVLSQFDYTYDARGQRTSMTTLDGQWSYEYDYLGQLNRAQFDSVSPSIPNQDLRYEYDALGNRVRTVMNGEEALYVTNAMNQYASVGDMTLEYDADGNLIRKVSPTDTTEYRYDFENRLIGVEDGADSWEYIYDGLGNRVASFHNGAAVNYLVNPLGPGSVVAEYDSAGALIHSYQHASDSIVSRVTGTNESQFYTFDAFGNVVDVTDASGGVLNSYLFQPFGTPLSVSETVSNELQFLGQWGIRASDDGLAHMRARDYLPWLGRFTTQDPLRLDAGDVNLYRYVGNDPLNLIDPLGTEPPPPRPWRPDPDRDCRRICTGYRVDCAYCLKKEPERLKLENSGKRLSTECFTYNRPGSTQRERSCAVARCREECGPPPDPPPPPPPPGPPGPGGGGGGGDAGGSADSVQSSDPNQKLGPAGYSNAHYMADGGPASYRIDFENDPTATAPAQFVTVSDQLDAALDWSSFELTEVGFGDYRFAIPPRSQTYATIEPMQIGDASFDVDIHIEFDAATGRLDARFMSLDPQTGLPPDVTQGFLPPEDGTGRGQGYFSYLIKANEDLPTGTEIRNVAVIQFDFGETIATNQVDPHDPSQGTDPGKEALVTIDALAPSSSVANLTARSSRQFDVSWAGGDDIGGSGVHSYTVYVSENGGPHEVWLANATATSSAYAGVPGHTYAFYSVARDNVGHVEPMPLLPQATTRVAVFPKWNERDPFDTNDDGFYSAIDALWIINRLNKGGAGSTEFEEVAAPYYDSSQDNFVSPIDALLVINHLNQVFAGDGEVGHARYGLAMPPRLDQDAFPALNPVNRDQGYQHLRRDVSADAYDRLKTSKPGINRTATSGATQSPDWSVELMRSAMVIEEEYSTKAFELEVDKLFDTLESDDLLPQLA